MATSLVHTSIPDQLFRELCAAVLTGKYAPGDRLPTQRALAAEYGVNMASVREAVKRMEQLRLLDVRHGDAMRVRDWRQAAGLDVLVHALVAAPALAGAVLPNLFEARRLLLTEAARLAAERRTDEQAENIHVHSARLAAAMREGEKWQLPRGTQLAELAFMEAVLDASGNLVFALIMNSVRELYLEALEMFAAMLDPADAIAYAGIAEAIERRDADQAAERMAAIAKLQQDRLLA